MSHCPYSDESLEQFDSVANPMGDACDDCEDFECEHNPNPDPNAIDLDDLPETPQDGMTSEDLEDD